MTKNEVRIPGYFEDGAQYATAWLAAHPAGSGPLAIWGCWDDPSIGAISALRQQGRDDVQVYGINGNAQALENIQKGFMTATAWQDSFTEGYNMVGIIDEAIKAGERLAAEGRGSAGGRRHQGHGRPVPEGPSRRDRPIDSRQAVLSATVGP